jgi:Na+-transporting NADH:ubiquinone oxidoreductase subunit NqrF
VYSFSGNVETKNRQTVVSEKMMQISDIKVKEGDKVKLSGPYGESFMVNDQRELIFLIGGAGSSFGSSLLRRLVSSIIPSHFTSPLVSPRECTMLARI